MVGLINWASELIYTLSRISPELMRLGVEPLKWRMLLLPNSSIYITVIENILNTLQVFESLIARNQYYVAFPPMRKPAERAFYCNRLGIFGLSFILCNIDRR